MLDLRPLIRIPLALVFGILLFWILDRAFHLTEGAFHHLFGGGILWTYLLVPTFVSFFVGFWVGRWGKFWAAIPPMLYILIAYLLASEEAGSQALGMPTAPFMMVFFITVPEVSFLGGWVGEVFRKRRDIKRRREARLRESLSTGGISPSERGIK
ncbi:MAG: hypothetical protein ACYC9S_02200 [Leptospirales bacterium]